MSGFCLAGFLLIIAGTAELDCQPTEFVKAWLAFTLLPAAFLPQLPQKRKAQFIRPCAAGKAVRPEPSVTADPAGKWKSWNFQGRALQATKAKAMSCNKH